MKLIGMYTAAGAQLAAQAQAGEQAVIFTRAVAGSGITPAESGAMVTECQTLDLHDKSSQGQSVTVAALLDALQAPRDYVLREVGLFAKIGSGAEVLYKLFRLDETLTVERDADLTVSFYLTETILQADQVQVLINQQGLVTEALCRQVAQQMAGVVQTNLSGHMSDSGAHSTLFARKAPLNHSHGASQITAGTLGGQVVAKSNENYTTAQVRNITISTAEPSGGSNGELWFQYVG